MVDRIAAIEGAILGCAVGDAIGLPYEGLSKRRGARMLGQPDRHRFLFRRGMVSDDTEHTCMAGQSLCEHPTDAAKFARALAARLRWWLLGAPAGIGSATLRATLRLWLSYSSTASGVFSAGNGPAMRSAVLGAAIDDLPKLREFVTASTRITHTDPKADEGAFAVALAAWCARRGEHDAEAFFARYRTVATPSQEFGGLMETVERGIVSCQTTAEFAIGIKCGKGVSGYICRTVPMVLFLWLRHPLDYRTAVIEIIACGGDTDTTAAILGAIIGSGVGPDGIPKDWLDGVIEWPKSVGWMKRLARCIGESASTGAAMRPPRVIPLIGLPRNALFLVVVLLHACRRLLPPY